MEWTALALFAGRILLGGFFVLSGWAHFANARPMAGYAASKGLPLPLASVLGTGALLLGGGLMLMAGFLPLLAVAGLAGFLVAVTPIMHAFWAVKDPAQRSNERDSFVRNMALLGAVLALAAIPAPWPYSL